MLVLALGASRGRDMSNGVVALLMSPSTCLEVYVPIH